MAEPTVRKSATHRTAVAATWNPDGSNPFSTISMVMATYWLTVFHLASRDAGTTTPTDAATARRPVTASSRPTITTTIHAWILSIASSETSAAATSSLSAIGSSRVPSVVTWFRRRASMPSAQSVIAERMKIAAAITACTREDEMRKTINRGTATMRVRVRPIGKFTLGLRRRDQSASPLSGVAHDLVNAGHVAGHERGGVEAQARVHVGGPAGRDQSPGPRRVPPEPAQVVTVAESGVERVAGAVAQDGRREGRQQTIHDEPGARPVLQGGRAERAGAQDGDVAPAGGGPRRGRGDVDERRYPDRPRRARRQERPRAVAGREKHGLAVQASGAELHRGVSEIESRNRLPFPLAGGQDAVAGHRAGAAPRVGRIADGNDRAAALGERGDDCGRGAEDVDHQGRHPVEVGRDNRIGGRDHLDPHGLGCTVAEGADLEAERVEIDEPFGVPRPVDRVGLEGGEVGPVEGARRTPPGDGDASLVEREPRVAGHVPGAIVHEGLELLALGGEPEAVVDHL